MSKTIIPENFAFSPGGAIALPLCQEQGGLPIESAEDKVSVMRSFDIVRDEGGLALAEALAAVLGDAIDVLKRDQAAGQLPRALAIIPASVRKNPFV